MLKIHELPDVVQRETPDSDEWYHVRTDMLDVARLLQAAVCDCGGWESEATDIVSLLREAEDNTLRFRELVEIASRNGCCERVDVLRGYCMLRGLPTVQRESARADVYADSILGDTVCPSGRRDDDTTTTQVRRAHTGTETDTECAKAGMMISRQERATSVDSPRARVFAPASVFAFDPSSNADTQRKDKDALGDAALYREWQTSLVTTFVSLCGTAAALVVASRSLAMCTS